jgi:deoxyadenosine/deoxycytidine kinase
MLLDHPTSVIQDRCVYEDAEVFAYNLFRQGLMDERDYSSYHELYLVLSELLPPPDLVIYLKASLPTLVSRISQRGRDYERRISPEYLSQLNELYDGWINRFSLCPVLTVPTDEINFVTRPQHLSLIVEKVQEKLTGKEEVIFRPEEYRQVLP